MEGRRPLCRVCHSVIECRRASELSTFISEAAAVIVFKPPTELRRREDDAVAALITPPAAVTVP
jgi:hypothetical protein